MSKRQRTDSAQGTVDSMQSAATAILPPAHCHIKSQHMPFWVSIVSARDAKAWTQSDLENAANLARCKETIERLSEEIGDEGDIVINAKGTPIPNPKHTLLETLSRRAVALSRMLHVHAEATSGKARDEKPRNKAAADARQVLDDFGEDDLIARPTTQ